MSQPIKIDGSLGEGGGQVLRISLCLSALYDIPVEIDNIRAGRPKPGLAAQHLKGVELLQEMCNAEVAGGHIGSTSLIFKPGLLQNKKQEFFIDTKTAGCIGLLIQIALPCALFSSRAASYILKGGTNVPMGPQIEYFKYVFQPMLKKFGADFDLDIRKKGYYPQGGGEVCLKISPISNLKAIQLLDAGNPIEIRGWSHVSGVVNLNEAQKMSDDARSYIVRELSKRDIEIPPIDIVTYKETRNNAFGNGSAINLLCRTNGGCIFGGSGLGTKRPGPKPPGIEAAEHLLSPILSDSCVDEFLQDQLLILMILAHGKSKIKIGKKELTNHTQTAIQVAKIMLGDKGLDITTVKDENGSLILECNGLGYNNKFIH